MDDEGRQPGISTAGWVVPGYEVMQVLPSVRVGVSRALAIRQIDGLKVQLSRVDVADAPDSNTAESGGPLERAMVAAAQISRIRHEHIIAMRDVIPVTDDSVGTCQLVVATAPASGGSLTTHLQQRGRLSLQQAITVVIPIGEALEHVHRAGLIHADLTSDGVVFARDGKPFLADIGIGQIAGVVPQDRPGFQGCLAPEVQEGYAPSVESDAYALGALVWHLVTGEPPGWVGSRADLDDLAGDLPREIRDLLTRALSTEPDRRPEVCEIVGQFRAAGPAAPLDLDFDPERDLTRDIPTRIRTMAARHPTSHRAPARRWHRGPAAMVAALALVAITLVAVTLVTVLPALHAGPGWRANSETAHSDAETLAAGSAGEDAATDSPPSKDADAADKPSSVASMSWREAVQGVLQARATAWESGDPDLLRQAHAADSEALAKDRADLLAATDSGAQFSGVEFIAQDVQVTDVSPEASDIAAAREFSADVVIERRPLEVVTGGEEPQVVPSSTEIVEVTLRRGPDGWRLWSWD